MGRRRPGAPTARPSGAHRASGIASNLLPFGGQPGTFVVGDLDGGWISVRRITDGGLVKSIDVGAVDPRTRHEISVGGLPTDVLFVSICSGEVGRV